MYQNVLKLYKPIGKTPLEMIRLLRRQFPQYSQSTLGYAGRLDPMAEGLLLILVDDENKKRKTYERLDKEYIFEILFGITTDTYDPLGMIITFQKTASEISEQLQKFTSTLRGKHTQLYPPYSSARVQGKPLFYWAREDKLKDIIIPSKTIEIMRFEIDDIRREHFRSIYSRIVQSINLVQGDFRQQEIISKWDETYREHKDVEFVIARCKVTCSSGTYIRSVVHQIGENIGTGAIALSIKRTRVGDFRLEDASLIT